VIINEIAWAGTIAHYNDEWIELFNPKGQTINLSGWMLIAADVRPKIPLVGEIQPGGYFLLERTDDSTIRDITADQIYTGSLSNAGETLSLLDPNGVLVDAAGPSDGAWPAGEAEIRASMERRSTIAGRAMWNTNNGYTTNGTDVGGNPILGTPRQRNSIEFPTPTPTKIPQGTLILINEFLPHPKYDWNGDGKITSDDEFIEIINAGTTTINLLGWFLDDIEEGSRPFGLSNTWLSPGEIVNFFRSETGISLSDNGDSVRLLLPDGTMVDERTYNYARELNLTWCRLPDGIVELKYPCWPTPGDKNIAYLSSTTASTESAPADEDTQHPLIEQIIQPGWLIPNGFRLCGYQ
jgi:hypothetical protein